MTALRPIESTDAEPADLPNGDRQGTGSRRSRRKAWRDGFAAQTVIAGLEDDRSYRAFERAIVASFGPRSVIELELIHRLASLFWRLRCASAIETGLFGHHSAAGYRERARLPYVARQSMKSVPPAHTKRGCGVRLRKRFGSWMRCAGPRGLIRGGHLENQSHTTFGIGKVDAGYGGGIDS
jgi:hypothetical protein